MRFGIGFVVLAMVSGPVLGDGKYYEVSYPPSTDEGELIYGVTYTLWVPDDVKTIRGVIVHQHGCGKGACQGGATAAYDLHWQALAAKWDCALLGPSYHQEDGQDCRKWCDPRNGSEQTFLRCLKDFAAKSRHPEIETAPWCLWGHSGGGFWSSIMQTLHPERIVAIWFRSGTAYPVWERGEIAKVEVPDAVYGIPIALNPGAKEKGDKRFNGAWTGSEAMFQAYRAKGAPACFAPDPRTAHECGDSRYLAIPFFDVCLALRLPDEGTKLKPIDKTVGWTSADNWLPSEAVGKAWTEYLETGAVSDTTPPPAPTKVIAKSFDGGVAITWDADADFESGLGGFIILRGGEEISRLPEKPVGRFGRPLFQKMSYHDTPEKPLPKMAFTVPTGVPEGEFSVIAVNSVGLKSKPAAARK